MRSTIKVTAKKDHFANLTYKKYSFHCAIGQAGVTDNKTEGDLKTPLGLYLIRTVYYRADRLESFSCIYPLLTITKTMGWCDDPLAPRYNQLVTLPFSQSHELLWREDFSYDIIVVLGYNDEPVVTNKGSAIFMHIAKENTKGELQGTHGCIALRQPDLIHLLQNVEENTWIEITES